MKRLLLIAGFLLLAVPCYAMESAQGWCERGAVKAVTSTISSTNNLQGSYPQCTVTVFLHGTVTFATIYSDNASPPTALSDPFTATTLGHWQFYVANGNYDVVLSGGGFPSPFTISDVVIGGTTLDCSVYPGANAGAKIHNCMLALPSGGGLADAGNMNGGAMTSQIWSGITVPGALKLGAGQWTTTVCQNISTGWEVYGVSATSTIIKPSGTPGCIFGGTNANQTSIHIHDLQIDANSVSNTTAVDLSNSALGTDCNNKVGPNLLIFNTTNAAVRLTNCGGSDTWIKNVDVGNIQGGICIDWHNPGGNDLIETVTCFPIGGALAPQAQRYGTIVADAQMVAITNSSFFGYESSAQTPSVYLAGDYIYPGRSGAAITATTGNPIIALTEIGGLAGGGLLTDSVIDGKFYSVTLTGVVYGNVAATGSNTANFFGFNFGGASANPVIINASGLDLISQDETLVWNVPLTSIVNNRGIAIKLSPGVGDNLNYFKGPFSIGAQPSSLIAANNLEIHNPVDAFVELFNTSVSPADYIIDAVNGDGLNIANRRNATGSIFIDPGATGTGMVQIPHGNLNVAGHIQFSGSVVFTGGTGVPSSACASGGNPSIGSLFVRSDAPDASHLWYICTSVNTWTALTIP